MPVLCRQRIFNSLYTLTPIILSISSNVFAATPNWQGPYVGAYVGPGYANNQITTSTGVVSDTSYFTSMATRNQINNAGSSTNTPSSAILGLQAGHDWTYKKMVYGLVMEYGSLPFSSSINSNAAYSDGSGNYSVNTSMSTNWLFTLRGKLGYQLVMHWPSLLYVTGGMAITKLNVSNSFSDNTTLNGMGGNSISQNQIGWAAGAGVEIAVFGHSTISLEYLYVQVPSVRTNSNISNALGGFGVPVNSLASQFTSIGNFHANLLRLGLNYRFNELVN